MVKGGFHVYNKAVTLIRLIYWYINLCYTISSMTMHDAIITSDCGRSHTDATRSAAHNKSNGWREILWYMSITLSAHEN